MTEEEFPKLGCHGSVVRA